MAVPFVSVRPKAIRLKVLPQFPANLVGRNGIDIAKENGNWFADLDYAKFLPAIPSAPASAVTLVWDEATNQYRLISASAFSGIPDAPNDGTQYGRQSLGWTPIVTNAPPPAPATATPLVESGAGAVGVSLKYAREDHVHPAGGGGGGASVYVQDTPPVGAAAGSLWWESDTGILYIYYNDGTSSQWVAVSGSSGALDLKPITAALSADVVLNNTANYFDGPSLTLPPGTWFVSASCTVSDTGGLANIYGKLWDGATVISSGVWVCPAAAYYHTMTLAGSITVTNPAGTVVKFSARDQTLNSGVIRWNASGNGKDSTLTAHLVKL